MSKTVACILYIALTVGVIVCHKECGDQQCATVDCIRHHDWTHVDSAWGNLHAVRYNECKSKEKYVMLAETDSGGDDKYVSRQDVWEEFQNFQNEFRNLTTENDNHHPVKLLIFNFASLRLQMEEGEKKITEVLENAEESSINYKNQAIVILQQDAIVHEAAINLFYKNPGVSKIYAYDAEKKEFILVAGENNKFGKDSRIQVVGHGNDNSGEMLLGKYNGKKLADVLSKIPGLEKEVGRISLVGCEIGKSQEFLKDFLVSLKSQHGISATVSARKGILQITDSGRKMVGEITEDGVVWYEQSSEEKTIAKLDKNNELVTVTEQTREHVKEPCIHCHGKFLVDDFSISDIKKMKITDKTRSSKSKLLTPETIDEYLTKETREIFKNNIKDLVQNKVTSGTGDFKVEEIDIFNNKIRISVPSEDATTSNEHSIGAAIEHIDVQRYERNGLIMDRDVPVRRFETHEQFIEEMNLWGLVGNMKVDISSLPSGTKSAPDLSVYYGIGDYIYRMDPSSFYIHFHGVAEGIEWPFTENDRSVNYEHAALKNYPDLWKYVDKGNILNVMDNLFEGNMEKLHTVKPVDVMFSMASGFSETIRNFRNYPILKYQIELNNGGKMSVEEFLETNPMTRGGSWNIFGDNENTRGSDFPSISLSPEEEIVLEQKFKNTGFYGFEHTSYVDRAKATYEKKRRGKTTSVENPVLKREINVAQTYLQNELEKNSKAKVEYINPEAPTKKLSVIKTTSELKSILSKEESAVQLPKEETTESDFKTLQSQQESSSQMAETANALRFEIMFQMDQKYLHDIVTNDFQEFLKQNNDEYFLVKDSIEIRDGELHYVVQNKNNENMIKEIHVKFDESKLRTSEFFKDLNMRVEDKISKMSETDPMETATKTASRLNDLLSIQGIISGFGSAIDDFENGDVKDGSIALAQSLHGSATMIGEITGVSKSIRTALASYGRNALAGIKESVSSAIGVSEEITSSLGNAGKFLSEVPVVSLGFGIYNAVTDFKRGTALGYVNFGFDIATMVVATAAIAFPPLEIVTAILGVLQIGFNEFWNSMSEAFKRLPPNASIGQKIGAVFEGIFDFGKQLFETFTIIGMIIGAVQQSKQIDRQYEKDQEFLRQIRDVHNYYKIQNDGDGKVVNFASGSSSWDGGDMVVTLGEDGNLYISVNDQPTTTMHVGKDVNSIVAGFGETHDVQYKKHSAKFLFIPVHSRKLISGLNGNPSTLKGTYYGNSKDNTFYTCQELPKAYTDKFQYTLEQYTYKLYGEDGSDMFFLGPQNAHVIGGEGEDYYHVPEYGGKIYLDNYANDLKGDILYINCSVAEICASRHKSDLVLTYRASHVVVINNWYISDKYRHMTFRADHGVIFNVSQTAFGNPRVKALAVIVSDAKTGQTVNLNTPVLASVLLLVGSNYSDVLNGSNGANKLDGGRGDDVLTGGNGKDAYEINGDEGCDTIDNYAADEQKDTAIFTTEYDDISISSSDNDLFLRGTSSNRTLNVCVNVLNWFTSKKYQHMTFLSGDGVLFDVTTNAHNLTKLPYTISMKNDKYGSHKINISEPEFVTVRTVIGTDVDDTIIGNARANILSGGKGNDTLYGGEGADSYVLYPDGGHDLIDNFAIDEKMDIVFFKELYSSIKISETSTEDLVVKTDKGYSVTLKKWFQSKQHQHMKLRSSDGVEFILPTQKQDYISKIPITIDKSESTKGVTVDTRESMWKSVIQVFGSNYTDTIYGNSQDNMMRPRQGGGLFMGLNGSDSYLLESNSGSSNTIDNSASDNNTDVIKFDSKFEDINVTDISNISVHLSGPKNLGALIQNFLLGTEYQHLIIETSDGISFGINADTMAVEPIIIDKTTGNSDQVINTNVDDFITATKVYGSVLHPNEITGNVRDNTLVGGHTVDTLKGHMGNDYIFGGNGQDVLMGGDGNDVIVGGEGSDWMSGDFGDDTLYGGDDADTIVGGYGSDTVIFVGNISSKTGVFIDLLSGRGMGSDAEGDIYIGVENIIGSEFDDILIGNDDDNQILGFGGNDIISPNGGNDVLNGGKGNDIYALESSHGAKFIILESSDNSTDTITLMNTGLNLILIQKYSSKHLMMRVGYVGYFNVWCPNTDSFGPFYVFDWFSPRNNTYNGFRVILEDGRIDDSWVTENLQDDTSGFQKSVCNYPGLYIAGICVLTVIIAACLIFVTFKYLRRKKYSQNSLRAFRGSVNETSPILESVA